MVSNLQPLKLGNKLFVNGVYSGCNPLTNLLLTSSDIHVRVALLFEQPQIFRMHIDRVIGLQPFIREMVGKSFEMQLHSIETNSSSHLKINGWKMKCFLFWGKRPIFRGELLVSENVLVDSINDNYSPQKKCWKMLEALLGTKCYEYFGIRTIYGISFYAIKLII